MLVISAVRRGALVALAGTTLMLGLSACDQIPSLAPADKAANKQACESIAATWNATSAALGSGNLFQLPTALSAVPTQVDAALALAKDKQLTEALGSLKTQAQSVIAGAQPDVAAIVGSGIGISARCTILGAAVDLKIPAIG
jgi:hypothetical protein